MENVKFVIPSFQRARQIQEKTLEFLDWQNILRKDIYVFVRNDDPFLPLYESINGINLIKTDVKGIGNTHNFITEYFEEGQFIVEIDDDLEKIIDNERRSIEDFKGIVDEMFTLMKNNNISYGGTYSVPNPMFMSKCKQYTYDLRYCLGCLRFRFVRKDIVLQTNYSEDFENCVKHFIRDGLILKNNWICPVTKNYKDGGCDGDGRNVESEKADKEFLANNYPNHCKLFQRKNGRWDLRLKEHK
tara:strand:- start:266 stop:997 length:732 start_codon:yes stop_codon:yes gene_type:complete